MWEKKGNYDELAWKVFNDVDDKNVYLKVLYYPKITSGDFHSLLDLFEQEYSKLNQKKRFGYLLSAGSVLFTWGLAYRYRFKLPTFALTTLASFGLSKVALDSLYHNSMHHALNSYANNLAKNYPEIKYARVEYKKSNELLDKM